MPVGQRVCQFAAQLGLAGLSAQLVDQCRARHWQPPGLVFEALQQSQALGGRQRVEGQFEQVRYHFVERIQSVDDILSTTRTHVRMISEGADSP